MCARIFMADDADDADDDTDDDTNPVDDADNDAMTKTTTTTAATTTRNQLPRLSSARTRQCVSSLCLCFCRARESVVFEREIETEPRLAAALTSLDPDALFSSVYLVRVKKSSTARAKAQRFSVGAVQQQPRRAAVSTSYSPETGTLSSQSSEETPTRERARARELESF